MTSSRRARCRRRGRFRKTSRSGCARAWRGVNYVSAACESVAVVLGVWLSGSFTISFNVLWCLILIGVYRVYFDAALGRFVAGVICALDIALIVLQARGVVSLVPIH